MRKSYRFRLHEFAADRFSFVQYPNVRRVDARSAPTLAKRAAAAVALAVIVPPAFALLFVMAYVAAKAFS
jgi:hypothetical protein